MNPTRHPAAIRTMNLTSNLNTADTSTVDDDEENDASTWGTKTDTTNRDSQHAWGGESTTKQTRHNSPHSVKNSVVDQTTNTVLVYS